MLDDVGKLVVFVFLDQPKDGILLLSSIFENFLKVNSSSTFGKNQLLEKCSTCVQVYYTCLYLIIFTNAVC